MPLPAFNKVGDLPEGRHLATLAETVARFGTGSTQRVAVTERLRRIHDLATATGHVERLVIFGSYVSDVADPNDVDVILVMRDDFATERCPADSLVLSITPERTPNWGRAFSGCVPICCLASRSTSF